MNKLFYIIYNSYYKHGAYKNDIPSLTVGGIFFILFSSILKSIMMLVEWTETFYKKFEYSSGKNFFIITSSCLLVYFVFYHNKRYQKIYTKYKNNAFLNSKTAKLLGFSLVIIMILSPIFLAAIHTKIKYGWWIKIK